MHEGAEGELESLCHFSKGLSGRAKGTSPQRSHGTGRDSLPSSGSCR